jgi:hypothetical protein
MISIQRLLCLRFLKFAAPGKHIFLAQAHVATLLSRRNKRVFAARFFLRRQSAVATESAPNNANAGDRQPPPINFFAGAR